MKLTFFTLVILSSALLLSAAPVRYRNRTYRLNKQLKFYIDKIPFANEISEIAREQADYYFGSQFRHYLKQLSYTGNTLQYILQLIPNLGLEVSPETVETVKSTLASFMERVPFGGSTIADVVKSIPAKSLQVKEIHKQLKEYVRTVSSASEELRITLERFADMDTMPAEVERTRNKLSEAIRYLPMGDQVSDVIDSLPTLFEAEDETVAPHDQMHQTQTESPFQRQQYGRQNIQTTAGTTPGLMPFKPVAENDDSMDTSQSVTVTPVPYTQNYYAPATRRFAPLQPYTLGPITPTVPQTMAPIVSSTSPPPQTTAAFTSTRTSMVIDPGQSSSISNDPKVIQIDNSIDNSKPTTPQVWTQTTQASLEDSLNALNNIGG